MRSIHLKALRFTLAAGVAVILAGSALAAPKVKIQVIPSLAPNAFSSPNFDQYQQNAVYAIYNGLSSYGDPTSPSFYQAAPNNLSPYQVIVTGFPSWLGNADPVGTYGPAYAGEFGNRVTFGLHIWGNGNKFSVSQLGFTASSTDKTNSLGFSFPTGSYDYSPSRIGIIYNPDGSRTFITSGDPTQLVDEFVSRGSGNSYPVYDTPDFPGATLQAKIDNFAATIPNMQFIATYTLSGLGAGTAMVHIKSVNGGNDQIHP